MAARLPVPAIVLSLADALAAAVMIPLATGAEAGYVRLFPEPASLIWQQEDENVLWLDTNLDGVELRISGLDSAGTEPALGFGYIQAQNELTGAARPMGRAASCKSAHDDDNGTSTGDDDYTAFWLPAGSGVGLVACGDSASPAAATNGTISLYSGPRPDGLELAAYAIDAAVRTALNQAPSFGASYMTRQICVDGTGDRSLYLSGNEYAGLAIGATDANSDTVTYALGIEDPNEFYLFFEVVGATGDGQIKVLSSGANDSSGLDAHAVYPVVLAASDGKGGSDQVTVGIQLNLSTVSPNGDGLCS